MGNEWNTPIERSQYFENMIDAINHKPTENIEIIKDNFKVLNIIKSKNTYNVEFIFIDDVSQDAILIDGLFNNDGTLLNVIEFDISFYRDYTFKTYEEVQQLKTIKEYGDLNA